MNNNFFKILTIGCLAIATTGCASFNGKMVNAQGAQRDCSASGGGIGLGAIVGMAIAYGSNQSCESSMEKQGFVHQKDIGISGIEFDSRLPTIPTVLTAEPPADKCLQKDDVIIKIDNRDNPKMYEAKKLLFGKYGKEIQVTYKRDNITNECNFTLSKAG